MKFFNFTSRFCKSTLRAICKVDTSNPSFRVGNIVNPSSDVARPNIPSLLSSLLEGAKIVSLWSSQATVNDFKPKDAELSTEMTLYAQY